MVFAVVVVVVVNVVNVLEILFYISVKKKQGNLEMYLNVV